MDKIKKQLSCEHEYVREKRKIETQYSYTIIHYKKCTKCGKEVLDR